MLKPAETAKVLKTIEDDGVVAVVRGKSGESMVQVAQAIAAGGVRCIELTFTTPDCLDVIKAVRKACGKTNVIGAGTVLDSETARAAILAGAQFIVAPSTDLGTIELCKRYSIPIMPGALTPTEVARAWQAGADAIKIFPANVMGPKYLKDLAGPFPQCRFTPTGGVDEKTIGEYIKCGAMAGGVGSALVDAKLVDEGKFDELTKRAAGLIAAVKAARG
ncbi:MAG: bifunctional 4-hydroxy-2-oxoglutarate aldolase/2-dehydro-3-deoxy-phosphogluconate aldolase [Phycisphaerae bacterium]|nr:bifunctional 4-hydroxy-2-oxoglutarate aldolase/2-dehydro-3-deoxy-phosphogluconate aldolase [Phycisphaerae bacterium]